jgi:uncharacterized protein YndB with AHSA1/START domain
MAESRFVYVTYIRTTPEKLWQALIDPEFTRRYWCQTHQESEWKAGASWRAMIPDGRVADSGEIVEFAPYRKLVLTWRNEFRPELHAEGYSRLTYELEQVGESVKLTIIHEMDRPESKLIEAVSNGWPHILASLKSLLETGEPLAETSRWPKSKMGPGFIRLSQFIDHAPAKVWQALTDPTIHAKWWAAGDVRAAVGHRFALDMGPWGKQPCEVTAVEPERLFQYRFAVGTLNTTITWRLEPQGSGTVLHLEQAGFDLESAPGKTAFEGMGKGWPKLLLRIAPAIDASTAPATRTRQ